MPYSDSGGGVTFRVWAPNATSVGVKGQFNGWSTTALVKEGSTGYWSKDVAGAHAGQEYKYVINGTSDHRDPRARRVTNSAGNSIIYDPAAFDWGGQSFSTPWMNDLVIYELHPGTYNAQDWVPSSFDKDIERLDHLEKLGISAVQVMPPFEFAGDKSWGYNPADPFSIESALGGPDAFKRFVKACHARGMAVLVDVVHNHYGPSDLSLWQFDGWSQNGKGGIYFYNDSKSSTMWGETRPDYGRAEVRAFITENIQMLLDEYRVDGFRWDSVYSMLYANSGATHLPDAEGMLRDINWMMQTGYPGRIRIAEDHAFDFNMNFNSQWDVAFQEHLQWQVTRQSDADRNMNWLADKISGGASHARVVYSESHDTTGNLNSKYRLPRNIDSGNPWSIWARKRQLLAASVVLTTPGIPMLFQGQEMNEDWSFASETSLRWELTNTWKGIVAAYGKLVSNRRNLLGGTQGLKGTGVNVHHQDNGNKVISYIRWDAGGQADDLVVVANFSATTWTNNNYLVEFPSAGTWHLWFNGDSKDYGDDFGGIGSATVTASGTPPKAPVNMGMYAAYVYSKIEPPTAGVLTIDPAIPSGCVPVTLSYDAATGPLRTATNIAISVGVNNWQGTTNVVLNHAGGTVWTGYYAIPMDTEILDLAANDGAETNVVWDNNLGGDWHFSVTDCANLPSAASTVPGNPQGCLPVTVNYLENAGGLKNATNVVLFIGRNGWQEIAELAMAESTPGHWSCIYPVASDTWQIDFVFHNGAVSNRVWDNNSGQDWRVYIAECVDEQSPFVSITNPPGDLVVSNEEATLVFAGAAGVGISGELNWSNQLTGAAGIIASATNWSAGVMALGEGVNLIRITGTNNAANPNFDSSDSAEDTAYTAGPSWANGSNGGQGWGGGWQLAGGANAGHFLAQNTVASNLNLGTYGWGMWAYGGGLSAAVRPLAGKLNLGDVLRVDLENNWIDGGSSVGIGLQNRFGQNLFEFLFIGGGTNYLINDAETAKDTGIPWTDQGLNLEFELLSPNTYRFSAGGVGFTGTLAVTSETVIDRFRTWNYSAGGGENYNAYLSNLQIDGVPLLSSSVYQDEVTITRLYGPMSDQDSDGFKNWEEELAGTSPNDASSHLPDIGVVQGLAQASVEIASTVPARWYDVFVRTNLTQGGWDRYGLSMQGSGSALTLTITNQHDSAFYRTGVYQP